MAWVERWGAVIVILAMTLLPSSEVITRALFKTAIPGAIQYAQHLTLWVGFLGALLATRGGRHLAMATGELVPKGALRDGARLFVNALSSAICGLLAYASYVMVMSDAELTRILPGGIPAWWSELIMPVAFAGMALSFVLRASSSWRLRSAAFALAALFAFAGSLLNGVGALVPVTAILLLLALLLGTPVFVIFSGLSMLLFAGGGMSISLVPAATFELVTNATLPAIPLLTVAGYILAEGGASKRLLRLARAIVGWAPGGMALMVVFVCAGFTTLTGGSGVTILALGGLVMPMLLSERYPEGFSLGLVSSAGSLGLLLPPSMPVILYAVVASESIENLYIAGFLPSLVLIALVALYAMIQGRRHKAPRHPFSFKELLSALWSAKWELAIPAIVVGAFFTGYATIVETAALAVVTAIVSQSFILKDLHWRHHLPQVIARGSTLVGAVLILLGMAMGLTSWLVDAEIPARLLEWTRSHISSPVLFLLALNAVLLVLGSVLEIFAAIVSLAPLLVPMADAYGIDPLHLGIIFLVNLELGFLFPPMGLNLILASNRFEKPLAHLYKVALPFLLIMATGVLLITYVPALTTGFLHAVKGTQAEQRSPAPNELDELDELELLEAPTLDEDAATP